MSKFAKKRVAVVGATGVVGRTIARVLAERRYPVADYVPVATGSSGDRRVDFLDKQWKVQQAGDVDFEGVDLCFFTAGAAVSREIIPRALDAGCRVVDNTTAFRMDPDVPLVVPEINGAEVSSDTRLVSCPNCTTINLVMALAPIHRQARIERVVVTSFQSVSGAGKQAIVELDTQTQADLDGKTPVAEVFPKPIAFNCIPKVGEITESGFSVEEQKIVEETQKIMGAPGLKIVPTAVRVPVRVGHALSVNVEFSEELTVDRAKTLWREAPGVEVDEGLPTQRDIAGRDAVVVGRLRRDPTRPFALSFWVVGDNLRKGAATNSVQIAELWLGA
jgi:aspartate-semialdehyde dehydrogenase